MFYVFFPSSRWDRNYKQSILFFLYRCRLCPVYFVRCFHCLFVFIKNKNKKRIKSHCSFKGNIVLLLLCKCTSRFLHKDLGTLFCTFLSPLLLNMYIIFIKTCSCMWFIFLNPLLCSALKYYFVYSKDVDGNLLIGHFGK